MMESILETLSSLQVIPRLPWYWPEIIERLKHFPDANNDQLVTRFLVGQAIEYTIVLGLFSILSYFYFRDRGAGMYPHFRIFLRKLPLLLGLSIAMIIPLYYIGNMNDHMFGMLGVMFFGACSLGCLILVTLFINRRFVRSYRDGKITGVWIYRSIIDGLMVMAGLWIWIELLDELL